MPVHLDRSQLPLVRITYERDYSDVELKDMLRELDAVLEQPGRKLGLVDLTRATVGSAKQRQAHGQWIATRAQLVARDFAAVAIVSAHPLIRGTVTAVFWIHPLPVPTHVAASVAAAQAWLIPYYSQL